MNSRELAARLSGVRDLRVVRASYLSASRLVLEVEWAGGGATATFDVVEVLAATDGAPPRLARPEALSKTVQAVPADLSEAEARRQGVPLWWSREWLTAELEQHGTFRAVAQNVGVSEQVISEWGRRHGISRRPRVSRRAAAEAIERLAADLSAGREWASVEEDAREHGVSSATVSRWRQAARRRVQHAAENQ